MADLADIERKQAEMVKAAMKITEEKDPEKILEMAAQVQKMGVALEKMARGLEAALSPPEAQGQEVVVRLTPDQKQRVTEQTGVGVEVVTLHDTKKRVWSHELSIGKVTPAEIEKEAAKEAGRLRLISETKTQVEKIIKQLEALNVPELKETLDELRKDPTLGRGKKK
jgi:hypothetical protein